MNVAGFLDTLNILWKGMLSIFVVTIVIMLFTMLLTRLTRKKEKPSEDGK